MRFITYWMSRVMEDPEELAVKWAKHCTKVQDGADELRKRWTANEVQTNGFWTFKDRTGGTRQRLADAEVNPVSSYSQALKLMDEKDRRSSTK